GRRRSPAGADVPRRSALLLADRRDLAVAVTGEPVPVLRHLLAQLGDLLRCPRLAQGGPVQDLALGHLRLVHAPRLGDARLLRVGERALHDAALLVLLAQPLHRELVRALRSVAAHGRPPRPRMSAPSVARGSDFDAPARPGRRPLLGPGTARPRECATI